MSLWKKTAIGLAALMLIISMTACGNAKKDETPETETPVIEVEDDVEVEDEDEDDYEDVTDATELINKDKLKEIADSSTFDFEIVKKEIVKDAISGFSLAGYDALVITIKNNTAQDISDVTVALVGYDANDGIVKLGDGIYSINSDPHIACYTTGEGEDGTVKAGAETTVNIACDADEFVGACVLAYSYKDAQGNDVVNPVAEDWCKNIVAGGTYELE